MTKPLTAEELGILRPIIESATGRLAWSAVEMRQMLATIDELEAEAERLRLNFRRITGWDDEQLEQGMIHLEEAAMVKARRLAGTEAQDG